MEALQFKDIRELLTACRLAKFDANPIRSEKGCWELFKGSYRAHVVDVPFEVLYFLADATRESIRNARRNSFTPQGTFVVYAPSTKNLSALKAEFEPTARGFWSAQEYLASFMSSELEAYRQALEKLKPSYYVEPTVQAPSSVSRRYPNPLQLFLTDPETAAEQEGLGSVAVVLAEAGHGKTYMCEWLVAKLATSTSGVLPVYVSSTQWQRLRPDELSSLGITIVSSFRALGTSIPWVDGQEDLFLKVALKAGLFRIVFDGFDEYVLKTPNGVTVAETLEALATLASETGTRVVVTSRTSFWYSEVPMTEDGAPGLKDATNISVYKLKPFDLTQSKNYFELRFSNEKRKISKATEVFRELATDDPGFAGRGFVLLLIADLVDSGENLGDSGKPLIRLMRAHCERDIKRHGFPLTSGQQLDALKQFVFEIVSGGDPSSELLAMSLQIAVPGLHEEDAQSFVKKMVSHALIEKIDGVWKIKQPQVEVALLAMQILDISDAENPSLSVLANFSKLRLLAGYQSDLAAMLTALCQWGKNYVDATDAVKALIRVFYRVPSDSIESIRHNILRRLSTLMAIRVVDNSGEHGRRERALLLAEMFPGGKYKGVIFFGGLAKFDWSGIEFKDCIFDNVRWGNCLFDKKTIFLNCHLLGGVAQYCNGFSDAEWKNCYLDEQGAEFKDGQEVSSGKRKYSEEHLKKDVYSVLEKFSGKGGVGFRSIKIADLGKGKISVSPYKDLITEAICRNILEEHHLPGGEPTGLNVIESAKDALKALFSNNAWTGCLVELLNGLKRRIGIT